LAWPIPRKHFDTPGKSMALIYHRDICGTLMALPNSGPFGARTGQNPSRSAGSPGPLNQDFARIDSIHASALLLSSLQKFHSDPISLFSVVDDVASWRHL
jgi:hypothetical protein